jgi:hypothetical protein
MGSKKNRVKKALAPAPASSPSHAVDDDLVGDLLTELDSRNKTVRQESATVLEEIQARQAQHAAPPDKGGGGGLSRNRFKARQVRTVHDACSSMVTGLSSRQGKPQCTPNITHLSTPTPMRSSSARPKKRSALSTRCATS